VLAERAARFRALHVPGRPFLLPCAWDAASARALAALPGVEAVGTTSAGLAWASGLADGAADPEAILAATARIAGAVDLPVSADVEDGYGDVEATIRAVLEAGAVGVNLEDGTGDPAAPLRSLERHAAIVRAAREAADEAGVPLWVNARTDLWWAGVGEGGTRLDEALERARAYVEAGADGIFVPAVRDPATIEAMAEGAGAPLNVLAMPGMPGLEELGRLGVARVSTGSGTYRAALDAGAAAVAALLDVEAPRPRTYADVQRLLGA